MQIKDIVKQACKNKTRISLRGDSDTLMFNGYITQIKSGFVTMVCFVGDIQKKQYTHTTKIKFAIRRITKVYIGANDNNLPALKNYTYPDFEHFYYDKNGLYFAETDRQPL